MHLPRHTAAALLLAAAGSAHAETNILIGRWQPAAPDCGSYTYVFAPGEQTTIDKQGKRSSVRVTYNTADPHKVYVMGNTASALGFIVVDRNTIRMSTYPGCTYRRVG